MGEDDSPLKDALKTFAGVNDKEEIAQVRGTDDNDEGELRPGDVDAEPSAEVLKDEGVKDL
jgi:hypothetical protein